MISNCALGLSLLFDELLIEQPFIHPRTVNDEFSPLKHPNQYRQEILKSVVILAAIMPLVEAGRVTLFPDPCNFDFHLRDQMMAMAEFRSQVLKVDPNVDTGFMKLAEEDQKRSMLLLPRSALKHQVLRASPELDETAVEAVLDGFDRLREEDPLAVLQEDSLEAGETGGQLLPYKLVPNFEITMYLAQATGSYIVTDSQFRWRELKTAARRGMQNSSPLSSLRSNIEQAEFVLPQDVRDVGSLLDKKVFGAYPLLNRKLFKYLSAFSQKGPKPNFEASLDAEFRRAHTSTVAIAKKSGVHLAKARVSCLWPAGGIQDNSVNRLLLMSSSEHHLASAPVALFVTTDAPDC